MKKQTYYERFMSMSDEQRRAEVAKFDREHVGVPGRPLTEAQKRQHRRAKNRGGRPTIGKGAKRVLISMERGLLTQLDSHAKRSGMTRSQLIAESVKSVLAKAG